MVGQLCRKRHAGIWDCYRSRSFSLVYLLDLFQLFVSADIPNEHTSSSSDFHAWFVRLLLALELNKGLDTLLFSPDVAGCSIRRFCRCLVALAKATMAATAARVPARTPPLTYAAKKVASPASTLPLSVSTTTISPSRWSRIAATPKQSVRLASPRFTRRSTRAAFLVACVLWLSNSWCDWSIYCRSNIF